MSSKRSVEPFQRYHDSPENEAKFRTGEEGLGIEMEPLIPPLELERAKNIFAFSPVVSGYEAKDAVECS
jgi:hypothetical protein